MNAYLASVLGIENSEHADLSSFPDQVKDLCQDVASLSEMEHGTEEWEKKRNDFCKKYGAYVYRKCVRELMGWSDAEDKKWKTTNEKLYWMHLDLQMNWLYPIYEFLPTLNPGAKHEHPGHCYSCRCTMGTVEVTQEVGRKNT